MGNAAVGGIGMTARFKAPPFHSPAWRRSAKGKLCTLRLDCCNHDPATTVLAHLRCFGWGGMGQKPHDFLAVYACSACHAALDMRTAPWGWDDLLRALGETLAEHHKEGRIA